MSLRNRGAIPSGRLRAQRHGGRRHGRIQTTAATVRVGVLVQGREGGEERAGVRIDEVDVAQIPARVPDAQLRELAIAAGDLEAPALEREGAVTAPLRAGDLGAEGAAELVAAGTGPADVGPGQVALEPPHQRGPAVDVRRRSARNPAPPPSRCHRADPAACRLTAAVCLYRMPSSPSGVVGARGGSVINVVPKVQGARGRERPSPPLTGRFIADSPGPIQAGLMFWLTRKRFSGSTAFLIAASRG
jgi:hypothetical protein